MNDLSDDELLGALGVEAALANRGGSTPREERLISGFEDIVRFHAANGRAPFHGEDQNIFERLYAVRLDRLRLMPEARRLLAPMDTSGLLAGAPASVLSTLAEDLDDAILLAELGINGLPCDDDITLLRNVRSNSEKRASEEIAARAPCRDFHRFQPLFERAERELKHGVRKSLRFGRDASITTGNFFILGGQLTYVAEMDAQYRTPNGETNARMRVIYSNGTESDLLLRSLQRALYKDDTGRRLTDPNMGPLFGDELESDDIVSGTIYVVRSLSNHPYVAEHRELIHKIGVTGGTVETRLANAAHDPTYLLASVEVVTTYKLANVNRTKLENLFHRVFACAQLDLTIIDRFGIPVRPREWFLVPLHVIDQAVEHIRDGTINGMTYDVKTATLIGRNGEP